MKPHPKLTIRRSDTSRWAACVSGEVFLDDRRVACLIGGRPRTIRLRPGRRVPRVRFPGRWPGPEAVRPIEVADGRAYQFACGIAVETDGPVHRTPLLYALAIGITGGIGPIVLPWMRVPARALPGRLYMALPGVGDGLFLLLDRLVTVLTDPLVGRYLAVAALILAMSIARGAFAQRMSCYLREEPSPDHPAGQEGHEAAVRRKGTARSTHFLPPRPGNAR
jgi:hypothetical protein